jgi:hypothetical protein
VKVLEEINSKFNRKFEEINPKFNKNDEFMLISNINNTKDQIIHLGWSGGIGLGLGTVLLLKISISILSSANLGGLI